MCCPPGHNYSLHCEKYMDIKKSYFIAYGQKTCLKFCQGGRAKGGAQSGGPL